MADSLENMDPSVAVELAKLARDLSNDPKTRPAFLRLAKQARPQLPTPEIDAEDKANEVLAKVQAALDADAAKRKEESAREELNKRRAQVKEKHGLSDEDVATLEKMMLAGEAPNSHDKAADYFKWMKQAEAPAKPSYTPNVFDQQTRDSLKPYFKNANQAARDTAAQALADLRSGRVRLQ